jgi:hypothetical protein
MQLPKLIFLHKLITRLKRPTLRVFFRYVDLKKKRIGYPSVMNFEGQSGSGSQEIYANEPWPWVSSHPEPDYVSDEPPFVSLQFTV